MSKLKALVLATAVAGALAAPSAAQAQYWGGYPGYGYGGYPGYGWGGGPWGGPWGGGPWGYPGYGYGYGPWGGGPWGDDYGYGYGYGRNRGGLAGMARSFFGGDGGW